MYLIGFKHDEECYTYAVVTSSMKFESVQIIDDVSEVFIRAFGEDSGEFDSENSV